MTKDEYVKTLQKEEDDNAQEAEDNGYGSGYYDGLDYAVDLAEKLDEPKKAIIPQFVASWIREAAQPSNLATISVMYSDAIRYGKHIDWLKNHDNQRLLLKALLYGYEIEKQKKYRVKIDSKLYFQRFENIEAVFVIDDSLGVKESSPVFTREVGNKILEILGVESGQLEEAEDY
jgi:hypothetical protein